MIRTGLSSDCVPFIAMPDREVVSVQRLVGQLRTLKVGPGGVLVVHSSFRAIGPVEGGPAGLIAALQRRSVEREP